MGDGAASAALRCATLTPNFHEEWGVLNERIGLRADQPGPPATSVTDLVSNVVLDDDVLDLKMAALRAHWSQTRPPLELVGEAACREWWRTESFRAVGVTSGAFSHRAMSGRGAPV